MPKINVARKLQKLFVHFGQRLARDIFLNAKMAIPAASSRSFLHCSIDINIYDCSFAELTNHVGSSFLSIIPGGPGDYTSGKSTFPRSRYSNRAISNSNKD